MIILVTLLDMNSRATLIHIPTYSTFPPTCYRIVAVILQGGVLPPNQDGSTKYSSFSGFAHLSAGLCCGLSGLAAGMCIGIVGDAGVRAVGQNDKLFVGMLLILIFAEAIGLYGLITALILSQQSYVCSAN
jgi:V-type H+-transporting ATPase proteolipid subunit